MTHPLLQNLDDLDAALTEAGLDPVAHRGVLGHIRAYARRYAHLETELLGHVWLSIPAHLIQDPATIPEDPLAAAETAAERERTRMGLAGHEAGDMMDLLEHEGLKVYRPEFPADSALEGLFLFDAEVGPLLVVERTLEPLDADYVFARLYAHYLLDNDPYCIHLALRRTENGTPPADLRAHAFAAAFLVSRQGLTEYLEASGRKPGSPMDAALIEQLAVYFEVGHRTLLARLLALGALQPDAVPPLMESLRGAVDPANLRHAPATVGERFSRLALEANARDLLDLDTLAEYLETDRETAEGLIARFQVEPDVEEGSGDGIDDGDAD